MNISSGFSHMLIEYFIQYFSLSTSYIFFWICGFSHYHYLLYNIFHFFSVCVLIYHCKPCGCAVSKQWYPQSGVWSSAFVSSLPFYYSFVCTLNVMLTNLCLKQNIFEAINIMSFVVAVYLQYHFQKQMAKNINRIANSTFWYGDLA